MNDKKIPFEVIADVKETNHNYILQLSKEDTLLIKSLLGTFPRYAIITITKLE